MKKLSTEELSEKATLIWKDIIARGFKPITSDGTLLTLDLFILEYIQLHQDK